MTTSTGTQNAGTISMHCAQAVLRGVDAWNDDRRAGGAAALEVSIGVHTGRVVSGNVGGSDRLEYTVLGDAANIASRIEHLTRSHGTRLLASSAVMERIDDASMFDDLVRIDAQQQPGRRATVDLWALANAASSA